MVSLCLLSACPFGGLEPLSGMSALEEFEILGEASNRFQSIMSHSAMCSIGQTEISFVAMRL